jgi:phosphoribosylformylglycinamidine cyclo-ligase
MPRSAASAGCSTSSARASRTRCWSPANDGVGTKVKIAIETGKHDTIGIDLVAMSVNDLVVQGAEPLFFLDYFATGKLDPRCRRGGRQGIAEGCREARCALIGGETAEMPGTVSRRRLRSRGLCGRRGRARRAAAARDVAAGDVAARLASSGVHSNGFSLVRKVVRASGLAWDAPAPFDASMTLGEALLEPTRIYVRSCSRRSARRRRQGARAHHRRRLSREHPARAAEGLGVAHRPCARAVPPVFRWLAKTGGIAEAEMLRTFNCGIGMIARTIAYEVSALSRANAADTVHWGYFSKKLKPQVEIDSGDFITIEALDPPCQ